MIERFRQIENGFNLPHLTRIFLHFRRQDLTDGQTQNFSIFDLFRKPGLPHPAFTKKTQKPIILRFPNKVPRIEKPFPIFK